MEIPHGWARAQQKIGCTVRVLQKRVAGCFMWVGWLFFSKDIIPFKHRQEIRCMKILFPSVLYFLLKVDITGCCYCDKCE